MRKKLQSVFTFCSAVSLLACGAPRTVAEAASELEGVYRLEAYTRNDQGCSGEGASRLESIDAANVVLFTSEALGRPTLTLVDCSDLEDCRARAAGGSYTGWVKIDYTFAEVEPDGRLSAISVSTGSSGPSGDVCSGGEVVTALLDDAAEGSIRIEERTTLAAEYPKPDDGRCHTAGTQKAARDQPCARLAVLEATRIADLGAEGSRQGAGG